MKLLTFIMSAVILSTSLPGMVSEVRYCDFSSEKAVQAEKILRDFDGNEFKLYELEAGYAIYSIENEGEVFIEGSYECNSAYYQYLGVDTLYYLGPGNYLYREDDRFIDILRGVPVEELNLLNASYQMQKAGTIELMSSSTPDPNETKTDINGFTVIKNADYFKKLKNFPQNWWGECGIVALSILLGYHDTFNNDNFIPNDITYVARYYNWVSTTRSSSNGEYVFSYSQIENLTKQATTQYLDVSTYSFDQWDSMPGTTYAMHDYLFDNYMQTFAGVGMEDVGYPMLDGELKSTVNAYLQANCAVLSNKIDVMSGCLFFTHAKPIEYINEGLPTCLVLQSYKTSTGEGDWHDVVAYGYQDQKFLTHFGWWPGSVSGAAIVINEATIYGYYTFRYTGEHIHSKNVTMTKDGVTKYICGCGYIQ